MTLKECLTAYAAVIELSDKETDYQSAYNLLQLKKELQGQAEFYAEKEIELVGRYAICDERGPVIDSGMFTFKEPERAQEFYAKKAELEKVEVLKEYEPYKIALPDKVTVKLLEALEGFIVFGGI